jgi:hypothetical protein
VERDVKKNDTLPFCVKLFNDGSYVLYEFVYRSFWNVNMYYVLCIDLFFFLQKRNKINMNRSRCLSWLESFQKRVKFILCSCMYLMGLNLELVKFR